VKFFAISGCDAHLNSGFYFRICAEITGDRPRQPAYEIKLMVSRVSCALAQISCISSQRVRSREVCQCRQDETTDRIRRCSLRSRSYSITLMMICLATFSRHVHAVCLSNLCVNNVAYHHHHHHHHRGRAPDWSVAVSTSCFHRPRSWASRPAEFRP